MSEKRSDMEPIIIDDGSRGSKSSRSNTGKIQLVTVTKSDGTSGFAGPANKVEIDVTFPN